MRRLSLAVACLSLLICRASARTGQFKKPSIQDQIKIGQRVAEEVRRKEKILPPEDPRVKLLQKVVGRLLATLHDEPWAFTVDVIESPEVNAFSLPGGPTFFYTGLFDKLKTEDELAGVLAHELTHVRLQHWAIQFSASQRRELLINLGLLLSKANWDLSQAAGLADDLVFNLPFSRKEEGEADAGGEQLVVQAGYNPFGMCSVFEMLSKVLGGDEGPTFLSDHPSDKQRIEKLTALAASSPQPFPEEKILDY